MKSIKKLNLSIIVITSMLSIIYLFFGNHESGLYKNLIIISILPVMLLPYIINCFIKNKIDEEIILIYLVFIFFAHFLGTILNFYYKIKIYDKLMHGISGIMSSVLAVVILAKTKSIKNNSLWMKILFIISITLTIASMWEFFEFTCDNIFSKDAQRVMLTGVDDTMLDMIYAFFASIIFSIIYIIEEKLKLKLLITKFIEKIS